MTDIQHRSLFSMHTTLDMVFTGITGDVADEVLKRTATQSALLESLLDIHNAASEASKVNESAPFRWAPVSDRLWDILEECRRYTLLTMGYFDITYSSNIPAIKNGYIDIEGIIKTGRTSYPIETNTRLRQIRFKAEEISLDFGGIGKGLLLREVDRILTSLGIQNCFVSFGGSSVLTRGRHPHGDHWPLSGRNAEEGLPPFVMRNDCASFSAGIPEGKTTGHIVHPYTKKLSGINRVTGIQCKSPVTAEVLSTVYILADPAEAKQLADGFTVKKAFIAEKSAGQKPIIVFQYDG
jgi:FAD:protein FMN transferase